MSEFSVLSNPAHSVSYWSVRTSNLTIDIDLFCFEGAATEDDFDNVDSYSTKDDFDNFDSYGTEDDFW